LSWCNVCQQDEWVVCRIFQKISGSKKTSFLYSDSVRPYLSYEFHGDSHSSLPSGHSPNQTISDDGECDTCAGTGTGTGSCYNCHDQLQDQGGDLNWVIRNNKLSPPMDISSNPMTKYPLFDSAPHAIRYSSLPQSMMHHHGQGNMAGYGISLSGMGNARMPKMEPYNTCEGEDEAQSSQRGGMDYGTWPVLPDNIPCEAPMVPGLQSIMNTVTGGADQSSCVSESCCEEQQPAGLFGRYRNYNGVLEMPGPMVDSLQGMECMWAY
jgi:hypothetical protein